ncbi:MAG: hypothetical protein KC478_00290 [Bacteriovoracaceae bacterium]|nr:hypothetical protein [Bacteriovoracaceae bacterium]
MRSLLLTTFMMLIVSCGQKSSTTTKRGVFINNVNRSPIELFKEYTTCEGPEAESETPYFNLIQFLQGRLLKRNLDMEDSISGNRLRNSNGISDTYYDAKMMLKRSFRGGELVGLEFVTTQAPKAMSICPGVKSYQRYSYENASLSANYSINKTISRLANVGFNSQKPIGLYIAPYTIERQIVETNEEVIQEDSRITDNAYYIPSMSSIVFLPQSEESREGAGFGNVPLWEVPMVGSHEYGHHVFHTLMGQVSGELSPSHSGCFGKSKSLAANDVQSLSNMNVGDVLSSLNEGFADLIAYYTLDGAERGLNNVVCMEKNREVGSPVFADNTSKLFTRDVLDVMFGGESAILGSCLRPNFKSIHTVGAVFSSVSERLMKRYRLTSSQKLGIILNWLTDLRKNHRNFAHLGGEGYLVKAYSLLAARVKSYAGGRPLSFTCQLIESLAPESDLMEEELENLNCR